MNIPFIHKKLFFAAACIALLSACNSATEEQDALPPISAAPPVNNQVPVNGVALNGYLANALVWIDARENNTPDGFESIAYTDNEGYFTYNPNTGINYCESNEESLKRFCLQTGVQSGNLVVKVAKGIELMTGLPFRSVLTANISVDKARSNMAAVNALGPRPEGDTQLWQAQLNNSQLTLSSMSSIAHYLAQQGKSELNMRDALQNMGFELSANLSNTDITSMDFIALSMQGDQDANTLYIADSAIGRMVDVMTVNLEEAAKNVEFGLNGLSLSAADSVYSALASQFDTYGQAALSQTRVATSDSNFRIKAAINNEDPSFIFGLNILASAIDNLLNTMSSLDLSSDVVQLRLEQISNNNNLSKLTGNIINYAKQTSLLIGDDELDVNLARLKSIKLSLLLPTMSTTPVAFADINELLSIMTISELFSGAFTDAESIILDQLVGDDADALSRTFLQAVIDLEALSAELSALIESEQIINLIGGLDNSAPIIDDEILTLASNLLNAELGNIEIEQFANLSTLDGSSPWVNKTLSLSGSKDNQQEGQIIAFFTQQNALSDTGELIMCVAYNDLEDPSANIIGKRFVGTWSVLNTQAQNSMSLVAEGVSVQMFVLGETNGRDIPQDQQAINSTRNPNEPYGKFRFRLNEEEATWHSDHVSVNRSYGIQDAIDIPQHDEECVAILNLGA